MTPLPLLVRINGSKNGILYDGSGLYISLLRLCVAAAALIISLNLVLHRKEGGNMDNLAALDSLRLRHKHIRLRLAIP